LIIVLIYTSADRLFNSASPTDGGGRIRKA
jgi:hypothetical protein